MPVVIPADVEVNIQDNRVTIKGPKGELSRSFHPEISITRNNNTLIVSRPTEEKKHRALQGLTRTLLANMVEGVTKGFEKNLELVGVGYRAQKVGEKLVLQVGYTHPVEISPPPGISFTVDKANYIKVTGIDKEVVGEIAAKIRAVHPPDSYKGKGIRYLGEKIRLKPGKAGKATGGRK
jgi:large subunit ribosomal protein L6